MKKLLIILFAQILCSQAYAWRESNGGNGTVAEATKLITELTETIWNIPSLRDSFIVRPYTIEPSVNLKLDGKEVDAYTTHDRTRTTPATIYIDVNKWAKLSEEQKKLLVLHEITHFMYLVDINYIHSQYILSKIEKYNKVVSRHPNSFLPIDDELVYTVKSCKLVSFTNTFLLIANTNYYLTDEGKTIAQLVEESDCDRIKEYGPYQDAVANSKPLPIND